MQITVLKSKIHRATVTDADLDYQGSISIDPELCRAARLHTYERVDVYNCNNGERFSTYVIVGGPGEVCLNGAAARLVQPGDVVIIACYGQIDEGRADAYRPTLVYVDDDNRIHEVKEGA
jgi:aspartate 1-decarboxylase